MLLLKSMDFKKFVYRLYHWETWDYRVKFIPLIPFWLWLCLRARSLCFFSASNPTITFGGFEGESKKEMYDQLPPGSFPKSIYVHPTFSNTELEELITANDFEYPFVVKPDVGMMGFMFRKIETAEDLKQYHKTIPVEYIIQEYIAYPLEVSVFYYRYPNQQKGTITGFLKKEFLQVIGDGKKTLWQLVLQYPRVQFRLEEMKLKHKDRLNDIIPAGEIYFLSFALNLSRGGKLVSLKHEKDEKLLKIFDELSHYTKHFYYGRYDIKCSSVEDLKDGKNFSILEYNGCGGEPHHIYGAGNNLYQACKILAAHWYVMYKISRLNHKRGVPYWKFKAGWNYFNKARKHFSILRKIDAETQV